MAGSRPALSPPSPSMSAHQALKWPFSASRLLRRRSQAPPVAGGIRLHCGVLVWDLRHAAVLLDARGPGDLRDLPHMRLHHPLLVHAAPAGRQSQQSGVLAAVDAHPSLHSVQPCGLGILRVGAGQQPGRRGALTSAAHAARQHGTHDAWPILLFQNAAVPLVGQRSRLLLLWGVLQFALLAWSGSSLWVAVDSLGGRVQHKQFKKWSENANGVSANKAWLPVIAQNDLLHMATSEPLSTCAWCGCERITATASQAPHIVQCFSFAAC